jgi:hypothetical protein
LQQNSHDKGILTLCLSSLPVSEIQRELTQWSKATSRSWKKHACWLPNLFLRFNSNWYYDSWCDFKSNSHLKNLVVLQVITFCWLPFFNPSKLADFWSKSQQILLTSFAQVSQTCWLHFSVSSKLNLLTHCVFLAGGLQR